MARAGLGWSARELAERAGLGSVTVARFETGTQSDPTTIGKIAAALAGAGAVVVPSGRWAGAVFIKPD